MKQPTDETKQEIFQVLQLYDAEYGIALCSKYILTDEREFDNMNRRSSKSKNKILEIKYQKIRQN